MKEISNYSSLKVKGERYYIKRLWFFKYIDLNIYDNALDNLTLIVSRENILEESFNQFNTTLELNLKKQMKIFFIDEVAQDIGGVYREWYTSIFESIFNEKENFFYKVKESSNEEQNSYLITLNECKRQNYLEYYEFIGKVIAKALFDGITIKVNFNTIILKHLLNLPFSLEDIKSIDKEVNFKIVIFLI